MDYKKKYLKYKKKYLEIKKFRGGMDQFLPNFSKEGAEEARKVALRKEEMERQEKYGVAVKGAQPDIEQASEGILNLTILEKIKKKEQQKKDIKTSAVLKWSNLAKKSENVFNNIEDCQKEVERLQELLKKKERAEELTPPTKKK